MWVLPLAVVSLEDRSELLEFFEALNLEPCVSGSPPWLLDVDADDVELEEGCVVTSFESEGFLEPEILSTTSFEDVAEILLGERLRWVFISRFTSFEVLVELLGLGPHPPAALSIGFRRRGLRDAIFKGFVIRGDSYCTSTYDLKILRDLYMEGSFEMGKFFDWKSTTACLRKLPKACKNTYFCTCNIYT